MYDPGQKVISAQPRILQWQFPAITPNIGEAYETYSDYVNLPLIVRGFRGEGFIGAPPNNRRLFGKFRRPANGQEYTLSETLFGYVPITSFVGQTLPPSTTPHQVTTPDGYLWLPTPINMDNSELLALTYFTLTTGKVGVLGDRLRKFAIWCERADSYIEHTIPANTKTGRLALSFIADPNCIQTRATRELDRDVLLLGCYSDINEAPAYNAPFPQNLSPSIYPSVFVRNTRTNEIWNKTLCPIFGIANYSASWSGILWYPKPVLLRAGERLQVEYRPGAYDDTANLVWIYQTL